MCKDKTSASMLSASLHISEAAVSWGSAAILYLCKCLHKVQNVRATPKCKHDFILLRKTVPFMDKTVKKLQEISNSLENLGRQMNEEVHPSPLYEDILQTGIAV